MKIEREKKETWQLLNKYSFTTTTVQEDEERAKQILEKDEFNHKPSQPNKTKNQYGQLYHIEKLDLVDFVDNEKDKDVVIIIHVFRPVCYCFKKKKRICLIIIIYLVYKAMC